MDVHCCFKYQRPLSSVVEYTIPTTKSLLSCGRPFNPGRGHDLFVCFLHSVLSFGRGEHQSRADGKFLPDYNQAADAVHCTPLSEIRPRRPSLQDEIHEDLRSDRSDGSVISRVAVRALNVWIKQRIPQVERCTHVAVRRNPTLNRNAKVQLAGSVTNGCACIETRFTLLGDLLRFPGDGFSSLDSSMASDAILLSSIFGMARGGGLGYADVVATR
jgi:hypothetical protein